MAGLVRPGLTIPANAASGKRAPPYLGAMAEITVQRAIEIAIEHAQAGRKSEAEELLRQLQDVVGNNPDACNGLGVSAHKAGLNDIALHYFYRAVALRPEMAEAHNGIGVLLRARGQVADALQAFLNAAAVGGGNPEYYYNVASTLRTGSAPEAVKILREILAATAGLPWATMNWAEAPGQPMTLMARSTHISGIVAAPPSNFVSGIHHLGIAAGQPAQLPRSNRCASASGRTRSERPEDPAEPRLRVWRASRIPGRSGSLAASDRLEDPAMPIRIGVWETCCLMPI